MFYNKQWTFIPEEEFEKIKKSFVLKNQKKIHQMKLWFWGWQKLPTNLEYYKKVNINWKKYTKIPAWIKWVWEHKIKDKYWPVKHIEIWDLNNPYKGNELDIKQDKIVANMSEKLTALGHISTGLGKTYITAKLIKNKSVKTLIVCSWITLMQQMKMDLKDIFWKEFFTIWWPKRKQKNACHDIVIWNIDTLVKLDKNFFKEFDMVILDEVDTYLWSDKRIEFVFSLTTKWLYWITWTIEVNHTDDKIFEIFFWPKFELLEKNFIPTYYKVFSKFSFNLLDMKDMHLMKEALYQDEDREELIIDILETNLWNRKGIIFLEYVEQAKRLREKIEEKWIKTFLLIWEISKDEREKVKQELKDYKWPCVLLGNVRIIWRWLNIPELSLWIMATAEKFNSNINQYIWRIIRKHPNKIGAIWYDIIDSKVKMLKWMAYAREKTFNKEFKGKVLYYNLD